MRTLVDDLEEMDYEDNIVMRKVLGNIHNDIVYWSKNKKTKELVKLASFLRAFSSINSTGLYQNRPKKKFITELLRLAKWSDSFLE